MSPTSFTTPENNSGNAGGNADGGMVAVDRSVSLADSNAAFDNMFLHAAPAHVPFITKHARTILVAGIAASLLLVGAGALRQILYRAEDELGRDESSLQQEINEVNGELQASEKVSETTFENSGFSSSFYQASQAQANLMLDKTDLEHALNDVVEQNNNASLFNTGAIYFIIVGLVCGLATVTVFLAAQRRPKSASIVG